MAQVQAKKKPEVWEDSRGFERRSLWLCSENARDIERYLTKASQESEQNKHTSKLLHRLFSITLNFVSAAFTLWMTWLYLFYIIGMAY